MSTNNFLRKKLSGISVLICFLLISSGLQAQNFLEIPVKLEIEKGDFENVVIKVKKEGIDAFTQSGASKMRFKFDFGKKYSLIFTKPGYITKTIEVNTTAPSSRIGKGFDPYKIGIKLFKQGEENKVMYNQPVARIKYDEELDDFNFDTDYSKSVLSAVKNTAEEDEEQSAPPPPPAPAPAPPVATKPEEEKGTKTAAVTPQAEKIIQAPENKPEIKQDTPAKNPPASAEEKPVAKSPAEGVDKNLTASLSSAEENNAGIDMSAGAETIQTKNQSGGDENRKTSSVNSGSENPSVKKSVSIAEEKQHIARKPDSGSDTQGTPVMNYEEEKITREDIVERNRIITKVRVTKGRIVTEYSRVNYSWGGLYFFKDSSMSISANLFTQWTGITN